MLCVVGDAWNGMSPVVPVLSSSCGGSKVFGVYFGVVASLLVLMTSSIYGIYYGGVASMSSSSWFFGGSFFSLLSTPMSSESPIIRHFWYIKIKCSVFPFVSSFTRDMTVSSICIASQILLIIFFAE